MKCTVQYYQYKSQSKSPPQENLFSLGKETDINIEHHDLLKWKRLKICRETKKSKRVKRRQTGTP